MPWIGHVRACLPFLATARWEEWAIIENKQKGRSGRATEGPGSAIRLQIICVCLPPSARLAAEVDPEEAAFSRYAQRSLAEDPAGDRPRDRRHESENVALNLKPKMKEIMKNYENGYSFAKDAFEVFP